MYTGTMYKMKKDDPNMINRRARGKRSQCVQEKYELQQALVMRHISNNVVKRNPMRFIYLVNNINLTGSVSFIAQ